MFSDVEVQNLNFLGGGEKWGSFSLGFDRGLCDEVSCSSSASPRLRREPCFAVGFASTNPGRAARLMGFPFSD